MKRCNKKNLIQWIVCLAIMTVVVISTLLFFNPMHIEGDSMLPTYKENDIILVNKMDKSLKIDDIVVFYYGDLILVKRVFAVFGDEVKIEAQSIYRNGILVYTFIDEVKDITVKLGEDEYFVLGDNIDNSLDSRVFGRIKKDKIIGKVMFGKK